MIKKIKKRKKDKTQNNEAIIDYNPDDMEAGEDVPGIKNIKEKKRHIKKDFSPDDFEG